jgi:hypothetical protein
MNQSSAYLAKQMNLNLNSQVKKQNSRFEAAKNVTVQSAFHEEDEEPFRFQWWKFWIN